MGRKSIIKELRAISSAVALKAFTGPYVSDEAGAECGVGSIDGKLLLKLAERPHVAIDLQPAYQDAFKGGDGTYRFRLIKAGR